MTEQAAGPRWPREIRAAEAGRPDAEIAALPLGNEWPGLILVYDVERRLWSLIDRLIASPRSLDRPLLDELRELLCGDLQAALDAYDAAAEARLRQLLASSPADATTAAADLMPRPRSEGKP